MFVIRRLLIVLTFLFSPAALAGFVQLDVAGTLVADLLTGTDITPIDFSAQIILDTSVEDVRPQADNARYDDPVLSGSVLFDGVQYDFAGGFSRAFVVNDSSIFGDLFAVDLAVVSADGDAINMFFQFSSSALSIFDSDAFPTEWVLDDFDDYVLNDINGTLASSNFDTQGFFTSAQLSVVSVPVPGSLALIGIGALAWRARRRDRNPGTAAV